MTEKANCQSCGVEYERYIIFYIDDEGVMQRRKELRHDKELEKLCKDCFRFEMFPHRGFALEEP
jgi:hypothetical protein